MLKWLKSWLMVKFCPTRSCVVERNRHLDLLRFLFFHTRCLRWKMEDPWTNKLGGVIIYSYEIGIYLGDTPFSEGISSPTGKRRRKPNLSGRCCGKGMWLRTIIVSANYGMLNITSHKYYFYDVSIHNIS